MLKETEAQVLYLKQMEEEMAEKDTRISKLKKEIEDVENQKEEEARTFREEIDSLQMKNIELIKNESLVKMYKK